jgi:cbb3-type cytochrome oxidase maturation protein
MLTLGTIFLFLAVKWRINGRTGAAHKRDAKQINVHPSVVDRKLAISEPTGSSCVGAVAKQYRAMIGCKVVFPSADSLIYLAIALALGLTGAAAWLWSLCASQYDDPPGVALRILRDDDVWDGAAASDGEAE